MHNGSNRKHTRIPNCKANEPGHNNKQDEHGGMEAGRCTEDCELQAPDIEVESVRGLWYTLGFPTSSKSVWRCTRVHIVAASKRPGWRCLSGRWADATFPYAVALALSLEAPPRRGRSQLKPDDPRSCSVYPCLVQCTMGVGNRSGPVRPCVCFLLHWRAGWFDSGWLISSHGEKNS